MKKQFLFPKFLFFALLFFGGLNGYCQKQLSQYFSPVQDETTGKWGVQYGDEIVVLPRFDEVKFDYSHILSSREYNYNPCKERCMDTSRGVYAYRERDKWGIANIYGKLTEAIYDNVRLFYDPDWMAIVRKDGKEGVINVVGKELVAPIYDALSDPLDVLEVAPYRYKGQVSKSTVCFIAEKEGEKSIINDMGTVVVSEFDDSYVKAKDFKKIEKDYNNIFKSLEKIYKSDKEYEKKYRKHLSERACFGRLKPTWGLGNGLLRIERDKDGNYFLIKGCYIKRLPEGYDYSSFQYKGEIERASACSYFEFSKDGKHGVMAIDGSIIIPMEYSEICDLHGQQVFRVTKEGKQGVYDNIGNMILPIEFDNIRLYYRDSQSRIPHMALDTRTGRNKAYYSTTGDFLSSKDDTDAERQWREKGLDLKQLEAENARNAKIDELKNYHNENDGDVGTYYIDEDGDRCVITDFGTDLQPLIENGIEQRLKRNPASVTAIYDDICKKERGEQLGNDMLGLAALACEMGYEGSDFVKDLEMRASNILKCVAEENAKMEKERKLQQRIARLDAISGVLTNMLTSAAQTYESVSGGSSSGSSSLGSSAYRNAKGGRDKSSSFSSQQSYNTDKRTYRNYDSMLAAYFAGNRKATIQEADNWQKSMKFLREKWSAQGKSFPKSINEDRPLY